MYILCSYVFVICLEKVSERVIVVYEVTVSMAASIAVDRRLYSRSGQSNVYETGIR
jgi:hypothetical protein